MGLSGNWVPALGRNDGAKLELDTGAKAGMTDWFELDTG
jgi:hypothetical protein